MGYCIMHVNKIKNFGQMAVAFKHNYRIDSADNVIPEMKVYNQELIPMSHDTYNETFNAFTQNLGYGIDKKYRTLAFEVMLSFSRESLPDIDIEKWKETNLAWLRKEFNACPEKYGDNIISAVYHSDEIGSLHIHAIVVPINEHGKLCGTYYLDKRRDYIRLQDSYAEAMKVHGLERGMKHSPAKHQDIQRMYGQLNKALEVDIPKWDEKDTPETYQEKIKEYTKDKVAVFLKQMNDKDRELEKAKAAPTIETTILEKKLAAANRKIHKYEKRDEELEKRFGSIENVKKQLDNVILMKEALKEMDIEKANAFTEQLNEMVARQRRIEKRKAEEEKKRKKSIFENRIN